MQKSWEFKDFLSPDQEQDQDVCLKARTKTKTDTLISILEALRGQDFVLEDDITARCTTNVQD